MAATASDDARARLEQAAARAPGEPYVLRLFISGLTTRSLRATRNIRRICDEHLPGRYQLEVVDIYQHPDQAIGERIIAVPTLVKMAPLPPRRMVGDLSDEDRVLTGLGLRTTAASSY